jgi:predicted enzyme related to lactoylglutathione lyase
MTTDKDAVIPFYRDLFGWSYQSVDMGPELGSYQIIYSGEHQIGGFVDLKSSAGFSSHWMGYVSVADVDDAEIAAIQAGGSQRVEPIDLPGVGRFAVVADPSGAAISLLRRIKEPDQAPPKRGDGVVCWDELLVHDPDRCKSFYQRVFGWSHQDQDIGGLLTYTLFNADDEEIAGMVEIPPGQPQRPVWLPYIQCADVDDRMSQIGDSGGTVWQLPHDIPDVGRYGIAVDPSGALFGLFEDKKRS